MTQDWQVLQNMTQDKEIHITRVEIAREEIAIEGKFELPPLAKLSVEDQVFIAFFIDKHGSIKDMERLMGVSYPTIKARLRKITSSLKQSGLLVQGSEETETPILDRLAKNDISVEHALREL